MIDRLWGLLVPRLPRGLMAACAYRVWREAAERLRDKPQGDITAIEALLLWEPEE